MSESWEARWLAPPKPLAKTTISKQQPDDVEIVANLSPDSIGSPIVDANGEVAGIVVSGGDKATARPSKSVGALLDRIASDAKPRWPKWRSRCYTYNRRRVRRPNRD